MNPHAPLGWSVGQLVGHSFLKGLEAILPMLLSKHFFLHTTLITLILLRPFDESASYIYILLVIVWVMGDSNLQDQSIVSTAAINSCQRSLYFALVVNPPPLPAPPPQSYISTKSSRPLVYH